MASSDDIGTCENIIGAQSILSVVLDILSFPLFLCLFASKLFFFVLRENISRVNGQ